MYYIHGGWVLFLSVLRLIINELLRGYFFGSVDQERYCMQRYAR